IGPGRAFYVI
nr:Chain P, Peptide of HIV gp120 MN isolate, PVI10 (IGPGRAFYVI) [Human immunodeficiency virus 1]5KD4_Q Chain Q, Peptide of HIV gp120 MN isolate, PVI10 (IGPGRAFYVI) [Human immunodeficiency virus 1]